MLHLEFCDHYSYPPQIKEHLIQILSVIDPSKIKSVLLYGSAASGEIGIKQSGDGPELYSDYDLVYIARGKVNKHFKMRLESHLLEIEKKYGANPFFHINFKYIDIDTYKKGLNNVSIITRDDGIVVFGEDLRHLMQQFNKKTLNPFFHNEMLIWALWKIIAFFPHELVINKEASSPRKSWWNYALCKETLVILMWLLPLEGVFVSTYRGRKEYLEAHYRELRANTFFGDSFVRLMRECYVEKIGPGSTENPYIVYNRVMDCFLSARRYMLSLRGLQGKQQLSNVRGHFFIDNNVLRVLYDLYLVVCKTDRMNVKRAIQWSLTSKYGLMFDILLDMNMALSLYLRDQLNESRAHLIMAHNLSKKLILKGSFPDNIDSLSFPDAWIALRNAFAEFLSIYIPSLRSFNDAVLRVNNKQDVCNDYCR